MRKAIIVDTEYTTWDGALESDWSESWQHKEIVQIAAIKVDMDNEFSELDYFDVLVKPKINANVSDFFTELTGIDQDTVENKGTAFSKALADFHHFCDGDDLPVICMSGDELVFRLNCDIHELALPFAKPFHRLRPFLEAQGVDLSAHSSGSLHALTDKPLDTGHVHYALHDVRSMGGYLDYAQRQGRFTGLNLLPTTYPKTDPRSLI